MTRNVRGSTRWLKVEKISFYLQCGRDKVSGPTVKGGVIGMPEASDNGVTEKTDNGYDN